MKKDKKESKRSNTKYSAMKPELNLKTRTELIDCDYFHKLSPEEKEWRNKFQDEYINANLPKYRTKLHKTKKLKKDCYDRNNSRNRDVYTKAKAGSNLKYIEELRNNLSDNSLEDRLIDKIDKSKKLK